MSQDRHQTRLPQPAPRGFQNQSVLRYTLSASGLSLESSKVAVAQRLSLIRSPDAPSLCEKSGLAKARACTRRAKSKRLSDESGDRVFAHEPPHRFTN